MLALKQIHISLALISIIGFMLRSLWLLSKNPLLQHKLVKITPHIVDTFLFASGLAMMILTRQYPPAFAWISLKLILIVAYIFFGFNMFRANNRKSQSILFLCAIGSVMAVLYLARFKPLLW